MVYSSVFNKRMSNCQEFDERKMEEAARKHYSQHMIHYLFYTVGGDKFKDRKDFLSKLPLEDLYTLYCNEDGPILDGANLFGCFTFYNFVYRKFDSEYEKLPLTRKIISWSSNRSDWIWKNEHPEQALDVEVILEEKSEAKVIDPEEIAEWGRTRKDFEWIQISPAYSGSVPAPAKVNPYPWSRVGSEEEAKARYEKFIALSDEEKRNFMRHYNKENGLPEGNLHALRLIYPISKKLEEKDFEFAKEKETPKPKLGFVRSFTEKEKEEYHRRLEELERLRTRREKEEEEELFTSDSEEEMNIGAIAENERWERKEKRREERKARMEKLEQTRAVEDLSFVSGIEKGRRRMELRKETEKIDPYEIIKDSHPLMDPYANPGM